MSFLKRFVQWQNYAHYLLLTIIVNVIAAKYGAPIDLNMFFVTFGALLIGDTLVHGLFWILPKPLQWRD